MGSEKTAKPERLAEKLKQIRLALEMSQEGMAQALERQGVKSYKAYVSYYESGVRVPNLLVVLAYARIAGVPMETLVDDELDLP